MSMEAASVLDSSMPYLQLYYTIVEHFKRNI